MEGHCWVASLLQVVTPFPGGVVGGGAGQMLRPFSDVGHRVRSGQAGVLLATTWSTEEMKSDIEGKVVTKSPC